MDTGSVRWQMLISLLTLRMYAHMFIYTYGPPIFATESTRQERRKKTELKLTQPGSIGGGGGVPFVYIYIYT